MTMRFLVATAFAAVVFTSGAHAADLPRKYVKAPVPVAAPFNWTGFYVGAHGGGGWGKNDWQDFVDPTNPANATPGPDANYNISGALAAAKSAITGRRAGLCSPSKPTQAGPTSRAAAIMHLYSL